MSSNTNKKERDCCPLCEGNHRLFKSGEARVICKCHAPQPEKQDVKKYCVCCDGKGNCDFIDTIKIKSIEKQDAPSPNPIEEDDWKEEFENRFVDVFPDYDNIHSEWKKDGKNPDKVIVFIENVLSQKHLSYNQGVADGKREVVEKIKKGIMDKVYSAGGLGGLGHLEEIIDGVVDPSLIK